MKKQEKLKFLRQIEQYTRGQLNQEEIDELWKKFLQYPDYYRLFEVELHLRNLIHKGEVPHFFNDPSESRLIGTYAGIRSWIYATAAAILIVIGLQFFTVPEDAILRNMALANIELTELAGIDIYRSNEEVPDELDTAINESIVLAFENAPDLAISRFTQLLAEPLNPLQKHNVKMNLGILHYNAADYEKAITFFKSSTNNFLENASIEENVFWFLGNSYLQMADYESARDALIKVYSLSGRFEEAAATIIRKIDIYQSSISSEDSDM